MSEQEEYIWGGYTYVQLSQFPIFNGFTQISVFGSLNVI